MEKQERAKEELKTLIQKMGFEPEIESSTDEEGAVNLHISDSEDGALIGYHGETLNSLQSILRNILFKDYGEWVPVFVDVDNYREQRADKLHSLAEKNAEKARFLSTEVVLPPMSPVDRREVHLRVSEIDGVESESIGEGSDRRVMIRPTE